MQSWWMRARARSLRGLSVPGVAAMHAARERCMHARLAHALHAHRGCSPCARRRGGDGSWWSRIYLGRRCRVVCATLWVACRLAATCLVQRRAVSRAHARAVSTSSTARITRGGRGRCLRRSRAHRGLGEGPKASEIASVSYRVRAVAAGVSRAGLLEILWSCRKFSFFRLSGAATRHARAGRPRPRRLLILEVEP